MGMTVTTFHVCVEDTVPTAFSTLVGSRKRGAGCYWRPFKRLTGRSINLWWIVQVIPLHTNRYVDGSRWISSPRMRNIRFLKTHRSFDSVGQDDVNRDWPGTSQLLGPPLSVVIGNTSASAEIAKIDIGPEFWLDKSRYFGHRHAQPTRNTSAQIAWSFGHHGAQNVIFSHG